MYDVFSMKCTFLRLYFSLCECVRVLNVGILLLCLTNSSRHSNNRVTTFYLTFLVFNVNYSAERATNDLVTSLNKGERCNSYFKFTCQTIFALSQQKQCKDQTILRFNGHCCLFTLVLQQKWLSKYILVISPIIKTLWKPLQT